MGWVTRQWGPGLHPALRGKPQVASCTPSPWLCPMRCDKGTPPSNTVIGFPVSAQFQFPVWPSVSHPEPILNEVRISCPA